MFTIIPFITFSQERKSEVTESMDQSLVSACSCGEATLKKIKKRTAKGKKIFFNPSEEAHNCAQDALNEYWVMIYGQSGGYTHDQAAIKRHQLLLDEYNKRVYAECEALSTLHKMKK